HHVNGEIIRGHLEGRLRQLDVERREPSLPLLRLPEPLDGEERRTIAEQTRVVLVAGRLMDLGLPAELRLDRLDAQAIRLLPAVAAAFTDALVDEDAHGRVGLLPSLAQPALLGRALLIVDERGDAGHTREKRLRLEQPVPMPDIRVARDRDALVLR